MRDMPGNRHLTSFRAALPRAAGQRLRDLPRHWTHREENHVNDKRSQTVIVALVAALLIPRVQRWTGVALTLDDIAALMAASVGVWHGLCAVIERYFPPPQAKVVPPFVPPNSEKLI